MVAFIAIALHPASKSSVHVPPLKRLTANTFKTTSSNYVLHLFNTHILQVHCANVP